MKKLQNVELMTFLKKEYMIYVEKLRESSYHVKSHYELYIQNPN